LFVFANPESINFQTKPFLPFSMVKGRIEGHAQTQHSMAVPPCDSPLNHLMEERERERERESLMVLSQ
jgi:hypothetical protein